MASRSQYLCRWTGEHLSPVNASEAQDIGERFDKGETVTITVKKQRSQEQLNYYWAKLKALLDSGAVRGVHDVETLHNLIKMEMGFITPAIDLHGRLIKLPRSIAMHKLNQDRMNAFMQDAWRLIAEHWHVDMEAI